MKVGVVVIGRNEATNLARCLESCLKQTQCVLYVDSGSTDTSVKIAKSFGVDVVELDPALPFTAARGRNTGVDYLVQKYPDLAYVQFIDGDCEFFPGWIAVAEQELDKRSDVAIICGLLQERYPEQSIYNYLCALEWRKPPGETKGCGGIIMVRVKPFQELNGFRSTMIGGEEPELCCRLRQKGWKIWRIKENMAWHDAEMTTFKQWWKRSMRNGHAYVEVAYLHGNTPERYHVKESISNWFWGLFLPLATIITAWPTRGLSLVFLLLAYIFLGYRVYSYQRRKWSNREALVYAIYAIVDKIPGMLGQAKFYLFTKKKVYSSREE